MEKTDNKSNENEIGVSMTQRVNPICEKPITSGSVSEIALVKREIQSREWTEKIQLCRNSGMSVSAWCKENGIAVKTYYYHLRKLREKLCEQIPVQVTTFTGRRDPVITLSASGIRVEISADAPALCIEAVINSLKC